ncbi:hypothetical protein NMG60_11036440 [Bertholletia excelsa]
MNTDEEKKCPLCAEEMDWTDKQLKPCQCGYQICVWCWHHLMDMAEKDKTEGRCPACRTPYNKEKIVGVEANCGRVVSTKKDRKTKTHKERPKKPEVRKDLTNVRVIQRKMAYVIGLPLRLADENLLQRKEYFGQYGKVSKISLSRTAGGAVQQFVNDTCSVYITYSKEEEAIRCIQSVHGFILEGRFLRASFGTAKYCHTWLKSMPCNNPACLYLHSIGAEEDSFGKDEEAAVHTRNRVQQIVGAIQNMQRRSGNIMNHSFVMAYLWNYKNWRNFIQDTAEAALTPSGHMTYPFSSKDKDGHVKTPNRTFVDIVGRPSSSPETDENVIEDGNLLDLCSGISSVTIDKDNHLGIGYSNSALFMTSSSSHLPIGVPGDKDTQEYAAKPFRESSNYTLWGGAGFAPSNACILDSERQVLHGTRSGVQGDITPFDDQRLKGSDPLSHGSSIFPAYCTIRNSDLSNGQTLQLKGTCGLNDFNVACSTVHNHIDEASIPFTYVNSGLTDRHSGRKSQSSIVSHRNHRPSNSFSNEEIVECLRRLDNDNITNDDDSSALHVVENSIISNILSMDFDACDDSLTSSHNLAELLDGTHRKNGSWNFHTSNESRFSFAKEENSGKGADLDSSFSSISHLCKKHHPLLDSKEQCLHGSQQDVSKAQCLTPGFSVPSRNPPPGFQKKNQVLGAASGNHLVETSSLPSNQYNAPSHGSNSHINYDFADPTTLVVGNDKASKSGLDMRLTSTAQQATNYEDEATLWLMIQQDSENYSSLLMQETSSGHQAPGFSGHTGRDIYGISSSGLVDQYQTTYSPSITQQRYGNGQISNGHWIGNDEGDLVETQGGKGLGFNKFYSGGGFGEVMLQMPSRHNGLYGM